MNSSENTKTVAADLVGLILIGGQSSRMGTDKALIDYHGKPQWKYLLGLLAGLCETNFLSCNQRQADEISGVPVITDLFPQQGPMGGILSAFQSFPDKALLTVPCDLPWLNRETISCLIRNRDKARMATTCWNPERESIEPLLTIWEPAAYPLLQDYSRRGLNSPFRVLQDADVKIVSAPQAFSLKNVNTPEDYKAAIRVIRNANNLT